LKNGNKINKSEFTDNISDFGGTVLETEDIVQEETEESKSLKESRASIRASNANEDSIKLQRIVQSEETHWPLNKLIIVWVALLVLVLQNVLSGSDKFDSIIGIQ